MVSKNAVIIKVLKHPKLRHVFLFLAVLFLCSHNLYIKLETYFLEPNSKAVLSLYNGTFEESENNISRDRILDASILASGERRAVDANQWKDKDSTITQLLFNTGEAGTYVVGVSTKPRTIRLEAEKFNNYLKHDGVLDMLEQRSLAGELEKDVVESYEKHVKAIFQVGDTKTGDWKSPLGYPIEFVPQSNPYESFTGDSLKVQLLLNGKPLPNQLVYVDAVESSHSHTHEHHRDHNHGDATHEHHHSEGHNHTHEHDLEGTDHEHQHSAQQHEHSHEHSHSHSHEHDGESHFHTHEHDEAEHSHKHADNGHQEDDTHAHEHGTKLRTNEQGMITIDFPEDGIYYLRTIHMETADEDEAFTHISKWATLSFEVTHTHDASSHQHAHHEHEEDIPTWGFVVFSLLIIGVLFFVFRKKN